VAAIAPTASRLQFHVVYRVLHGVNTYFALTIFWFYVAAFAVTFPFVFVFPPMPLLMIFLAITCLGMVVVLAKVLAALENLVVRQLVRRGTCPHCRHANPPVAPTEGPWVCEHCGAVFLMPDTVAKAS
jgi:hypothetical protein